MKKRYKKPRTVELVRSTYQPTKAELKEDLRADATMDEIGSALVQPVNVRWIDKPRNRNAEGGFAGLASPPWVGGREQRRQGEGESSGAPADGEVTRDYVLRRSVKRPRLSKVDRGFWGRCCMNAGNSLIPLILRFCPKNVTC